MSLTIEQAMALCGFTSRTAFLQACSRRGAPVLRINSRVFRYDPSALEAWLDSVSEDKDWWRSTDE